MGIMVFFMGGAVSYERGTPVARGTKRGRCFWMPRGGMGGHGTGQIDSPVSQIDSQVSQIDSQVSKKRVHLLARNAFLHPNVDP